METPVSSRLVNGIRIFTGKFENHLRYYLCDLPDASSYFNIYMINKAGAGYERDSQLGISHFLEHLCLGFAKEESCKFRVRGSTRFDYTIYQLCTQSLCHIPEILDKLQGILTGSGIEVSRLEEIRKDVIQEWMEDQQNKNSQNRNEIFEKFFGTDISRCLPIGKLEYIRNMTEGDLMDYHRKHYTPGSSAVICLGHMECNDDMLKQFGIYFERVPDRPFYEFRSSLLSIPHRRKSVIHIVKRSSGCAVAEIYCLLKYGGLEEDKKQYFQLLLFFSLMEIMADRQLEGIRLKKNECSIHRNRLVKELEIISYDMVFDSDSDIDLQDLNGFIDKEIHLIKEGGIEQEAFLLAKKETEMAIKQASQMILPLNLIVNNFLYDETDFDVSNDIRIFEGLQVTARQIVGFCKNLF